MITKTIGNTTIHFEPLIVFGILVGTILLLQVIRSIVLEQKFKKITKDIAAGNYFEITQIGESLLNKYQSYSNRLNTKNLSAKVEYLNFALAVSYFALSNDEKFLYRINELNQSPDIKEFWLSLFYLQKEDFETFKVHADRIACVEGTYVNRTFLNAYFYYKQHQNDIACEKMTAIFESLTHPILITLAESILHPNQT